VKEDIINSHLDRNCADEPRVKPLSKAAAIPAPSEKPITRPERLPQLHYSMVKDNVLRKKLSDLGISTGGSRQLLEKRYTEWVTLWNANCDATNPKGKNALKRELDIWERTQGSKAGSLKQDSGAQIRDKDFDGKAYSTKHEDSFRQLIANAKKKPAVKPSTPEPSEPVDLTGSPTPVNAPDLRPASLVDTEMAGKDDLLVQAEQSRVDELPKKPSSQRRFFEESPADPSQLPPSSQYSILERDPGISSDLTTLRPLQP
jgi:E3 ubiquitin-protein ligase RAD18